MVDTQNFFEAALPPNGVYCVVGIKDGATKPKFTDGIAGLLRIAKDFDDTGHNAYFACHTFSEKRRLQDFAKEVRSFYLDLDCGEDKVAKGKGYATKADALAALKKFCADIGLPKPFVIDSGGGLHVYWLLDEPVQSAAWVPVARAFKRAAMSLGLAIDPAVPADSARILRVPGTHNYKNVDSPSEVVLLVKGSTIPFSRMEEAVSAYKAAPKIETKWGLDETTRALMGNQESNFAKIARKSLNGEGCAQMAHAIKSAATLEEPLWHAALSIAARCNDASTAIHKISKAHPGYNAEATESKAANSGGPRTCAWYRAESGNGAQCKKCKHKITSPIQIGRVVIEREEAPDEAAAEEVEAVAAAEVTPQLPYPYFRGKNGGIYRKDKSESGEVDDILISEDDLFVVNRIVDPHDGVCAVLRLHAPHDPTLEFAVPLRTLQTFDKFKDVMSEKGIVAGKKGMENLMAYTTSYVKMLRAQIKAEEARTQFGWADGDKKFILGDREITANGIGKSPPSSITRDLAPYLCEKGSFEKWKHAFSMYKDTPGCEAQVFALMSAFGSPLVKYTGMAGVLISLTHNTSGTGKTTILRLINSVWGHPDELMQLEKDTVNAKQHRMGLMSSLPNTFDEMTNMPAQDLSDTIYGITHGRGKNRMRADANVERTNTTRWNGISVYSGNASVVDKLAVLKATSEGEQMRIMEYKVHLAMVSGANAHIADIAHNYGLAGTIYAQALVAHASKLPRMLDKIRGEIAGAMEAQVKERFWVNGIAANIAGGVIAHKLGLHDYDMDHIKEWAINDAVRRRGEIKAHIISSGDMLGEYLLDNFGGVLSVDNNKQNPLTGSHVFRMPYGKISSRFERDTAKIYIPKKEFKEYCVKRQGDLSDALYAKNPDYMYEGTKKKRMASGSGIVSPAVDTYEFTITGGLLESLRGDDMNDA